MKSWVSINFTVNIPQMFPFVEAASHPCEDNKNIQHEVQTIAEIIKKCFIYWKYNLQGEAN